MSDCIDPKMGVDVQTPYSVGDEVCPPDDNTAEYDLETGFALRVDTLNVAPADKFDAEVILNRINTDDGAQCFDNLADFYVSESEFQEAFLEDAIFLKDRGILCHQRLQAERFLGGYPTSYDFTTREEALIALDDWERRYLLLGRLANRLQKGFVDETTAWFGSAAVFQVPVEVGTECGIPVILPSAKMLLLPETPTVATIPNVSENTALGEGTATDSLPPAQQKMVWDIDASYEDLRQAEEDFWEIYESGTDQEISNAKLHYDVSFAIWSAEITRLSVAYQTALVAGLEIPHDDSLDVLNAELDEESATILLEIEASAAEIIGEDDERKPSETFLGAIFR